MRQASTRWIAIPLLAMLLACRAQAAQTTISLANLAGSVEVSPGAHAASPSLQWIAARPGTAIAVGDAVRTGADGSALLRHGPCELYLKPGTTAIIGYTSVEVREGALWFRMRKSPEGFKFITDVAAATIRGTKGLLSATSEYMTVSLLEGKVEVTSPTQDYMLYPLHEVTARRSGKLEVARLTGSQVMDLHRQFYSEERSLGGAGGGTDPGTTGSSSTGATGSRSDASGALRNGSGVYDPATARALSAVTVAPAGPPPLITVIDNSASTVVRSATTVVGGIGGTVTTLVPVIGGAAGAVVGGATSVVGSVVGGATGAVGSVVGGATGVVGGVVGGATGLVGGVVGGATGIVGGATGVVGGVVGGATGVVGGVVGGATGVVGGVVGGATGVVGGVVGGLTGGTGGTGGLGGGLSGGLGGLLHR